MVYIPWAEYGICKFWMLKRCYSGDRCRWAHPAEPERKRLWDHFTAKQAEDERLGIAPPKPPLRTAYDGVVTGVEQFGFDGASSVPVRLSGAASEQSATPGRYGPDRAPCPPHHPYLQDDSRSLPQLSVPSQGRSPSNGREDEGRELHRAPSTGDAPVGTVGLRSEPNEELDGISSPTLLKEQVGSHEVSMLGAPPSPKKHKGVNNCLPLGNANQEPLGKANRIWGDTTDAHMAAGVWPSSSCEQWRLQVEAKETDLTLSSGLPSANAVTVWQRPDEPANTHMTGSGASLQGKRYWRRFKDRDERAKEKGEGDSTNLKGDDGLGPTFLRGNARSGLQTSPTAGAVLPTPHDNTELADMGATKRLSNGEPKHVGPHPSKIRVSAPYMSQSAIEKKLQPPPGQAPIELQERSIAEAREDSMRLQGCTWLDNVRRALQLPIRTYTTACVYYHKFRLANPGTLTGMEYGSAWADACAASILTSCKVEDTLKKSRDILAAAYNLKASTHDQLGSDDAVFETPSRAVIGLERMVLEAGGFDFRSKYPHKLLMKIAKMMPEGMDGERERVSKLAWTILTDLHRTFAPLKQTSAAMALASLELAAHLFAASSPNNTSTILDELQQIDIRTWSTSREEIMETLLDALDLYTQHTGNTILGTKYSLDDFLRIRLAFNKECSEKSLPRYTIALTSDRATSGTTLQVANGHPTPVSPPQLGGQTQTQPQNANATPDGGATLRFMLNPQLASDEKTTVQKYFVEEWEEYEEEIEIPVPRPRSRERERQVADRPKDGARSERSDRDIPRGKDERDRDRERERPRDRERELERERAARVRDGERDRVRDRGGRYDDRRFDDRDRRYDDRRDRRYDDRGYDDRRYEDRRRRDDRR